MLLLVLLVVLFICFYIIHNNEKFENNENNEYIIVCAKYKNDVSFLDELKIPYKVITKEVVPNKAAEASSYLYYIIHNYDNLPENTIFIHDHNESWHHDGKITEEMTKYINNYEKNNKKYYSLNNKIVNISDQLDNEIFIIFWNDIMKESYGEFKDALPKDIFCCAQFIVSKKTIKNHPKEFYIKYYNWLINNTNEDIFLYSSYMTGRYAEWTWNFVFS